MPDEHWPAEDEDAPNPCLIVGWDEYERELQVSYGEALCQIPVGDRDRCAEVLSGVLSTRLAAGVDIEDTVEELHDTLPCYKLMMDPRIAFSECNPVAPTWALLRFAHELDAAYRSFPSPVLLHKRVLLAEAVAETWRHEIDAPRDPDAPESRSRYCVRRLEHAAKKWFALAAENAHLFSCGEQAALERDIHAWHHTACARDETCRRASTDSIVDGWALRARLSPWLAQDAEQAGLGRWASLFFGFGRVILHTCGFILLLAAIVGVFSGGSADWLGAAAPRWLTVIAGVYVAVIIASPYLGRAYVPRLLALSVIGYMALTQLPEARHPQGGGSWQPVALALGSVLLVWLYMLFGELRAKTRLWRPYVGRALYLTALGWAHSMSAGLLGFSALRWQVPETQFVVLAAWAPMALAIGIIAQTLWQRDAITEPI